MDYLVITFPLSDLVLFERDGMESAINKQHNDFVKGQK